MATFLFEYRFITPRMAAGKTNFTVRARATDTGGQLHLESAHHGDVVARCHGPDRGQGFPLGGGRVVSSVTAYFSEPITASSLAGSGFVVISAGADGVLVRVTMCRFPAGRSPSAMRITRSF